MESICLKTSDEKALSFKSDTSCKYRSITGRASTYGGKNALYLARYASGSRGLNFKFGAE